ncbi:hypothetical protein GF413_00500 [Candidatus Micrarchaeota archaeon]|nr:hypothetical protein [Candidatus Micrarchaeota archaeon]
MAYDSSLVDGGIERLVETYDNAPALIFSSAYPFVTSSDKGYVLKRPDLPLYMMDRSPESGRVKDIKRLKELKKSKWILVGEQLQINLQSLELMDEAALVLKLSDGSPLKAGGYSTDIPSSASMIGSQAHNSINRLTGTTGEPPFAPFTLDHTYYLPGLQMVIFALFNEAMVELEKVTEGLRRIGSFGFGKDSSTGKGRFNVIGSYEIEKPCFEGAHGIYCLGPCLPKAGTFNDVYYKPFVRFGRHGDRLATSSKPFKNPVLMADEGAIFLSVDTHTLGEPYFGQSVTGVSDAMDKAVTQGYSICLPVKTEQ